MNGIISAAVPPPFSKPKVSASVTVSLCLFAGFFCGFNIAGTSLQSLNPFRMETLHFDKISWIKDEVKTDIRIVQTVETNSSNDLAFVPFELKNEKAKRFFYKSFRASRASNLARLHRVINQLEESVKSRLDPFQDYQHAAHELRNDFQVAISGEPLPTAQTIAMVDSSAIRVSSGNRTKELESSLEIAQKAGNQDAQTTSSPAASEKDSQAPSPVASAAVLSKLPEASPLGGAQYTSDELGTPQSQISVAAATDGAKPAMFATQKAKSSKDEENEIPLVTTRNDDQLSATDKKILTEKLLSAQLMSQASVEIAKTSPLKKKFSASTGRPTAKGNPTLLSHAEDQSLAMQTARIAKADTRPMTAALTDPPVLFESERAVRSKSIDKKLSCEILPNHEFIRPLNGGAAEMSLQTCPAQKSWISKTARGGWVKLSGESHLSTVTLDPAPNGGATLLIDQNALALIALKNGAHVTKGMGIILGTLPENYKATFSGRAEETEYFETNGKSYFAILNVEPGAGIVELSSKNNQNSTSTIFTPVLEDTVSFLDLVTPVKQDLPVKVTKSGQANDPEIMNLTVGISTQSGIQAITQANGQAVLKNVNLEPGFPIFVDVSSRNGQLVSYTYRFELKKKEKSGYFLVNQFEESSIRNWLRQVKQGLSDQSAMVVGFYDRKKLDGFRNHYFAKVEPLTAKFGLEPMNFSILWNGTISSTEPLEGDAPRFMTVQVAEGLSQVHLLNEAQQPVLTELLPISPRVIHVISN